MESFNDYLAIRCLGEISLCLKVFLFFYSLQNVVMCLIGLDCLTV